MAIGKSYRHVFEVPTSGTFYTQHFESKTVSLNSVHLFSEDPVVVTDLQYQTSNWKDERQLSGSGGNKYWWTERCSDLDDLATTNFTGSADTSVIAHISSMGTKYWRLKITCDAGGVFIMNAHNKDE